MQTETSKNEWWGFEKSVCLIFTYLFFIFMFLLAPWYNIRHVSWLSSLPSMQWEWMFASKKVTSKLFRDAFVWETHSGIANAHFPELRDWLPSSGPILGQILPDNYSLSSYCSLSLQFLFRECSLLKPLSSCTLPSPLLITTLFFNPHSSCKYHLTWMNPVVSFQVFLTLRLLLPRDLPSL